MFYVDVCGYLIEGYKTIKEAIRGLNMIKGNAPIPAYIVRGKYAMTVVRRFDWKPDVPEDFDDWENLDWEKAPGHWEEEE